MKTSTKHSTSEARLIKKIASFGTAEGTDDLDSDDPKTYERWAKSIISIVRRHDRRSAQRPKTIVVKDRRGRKVRYPAW